MSTHWLYSIHEAVGDWKPGTAGRYWVYAQEDDAGKVKRRKTDGKGAGERQDGALPTTCSCITRHPGQSSPRNG